MTESLQRRVQCPRCAAAVTLDAEALADKRVDCPHCKECSEVVPGLWLDAPPVAARALAVRAVMPTSLTPEVPEEHPHVLVGRPTSDEITVRPRLGRWHAKAIGPVLGWLVLLMLAQHGVFAGLVLGAFALLLGTGVGAATVAGMRSRLCFEAEGLIVRKKLLGWPSSGQQIGPGRPCTVATVRSAQMLSGAYEYLVVVEQDDRRLEVGRGMMMTRREAEDLVAEVRTRLEAKP